MSAPWWRLLQGRQGRMSASAARRPFLLAMALAVGLATAGAAATAPWRLVDLRIFDYLSTFLPPERPADGPLIVAIDEPSFGELGQQWPWPRSLHARLVEALRIAGATVIGLDIVFSEPSQRDEDKALAAALGGDTVLAADVSIIPTAQADMQVRTEPLPEFVFAGAWQGITSIVLDGDGTMRRLPRMPDAFASTLLQARGVPVAPVPEGALLQSFGPSRTYETVSYYQALNPEEFLPPGLFSGRTVLVGLSLQTAAQAAHGGADAYATPFTPRSRRLVSGVEIQANIYDNLRASLWIASAPDWARLLSVIAAVSAGMILVWKRTGWRTAVVTLGGMVVMVAGSWLAIRFGRVFLPPLAPAVAFAGVALGQGMADYVGERRLRRGIQRAFSQYLSPVLVKRLAADPSRLKLGGEKRVLTVLFSDMRGFTTIAEGMKDDPERLTALVNRCLTPLSDAILKEDGTIDKFMGDAVMAFWNAPIDMPDHAERAVRAGLAMLSAVDALNRELAAEAVVRGEAPIAVGVGVGINTGSVVVGNMGSTHRFDYSAIGDAVNLASRLEAQTRIVGAPILLGPETARLVGKAIPLVALPPVAVKGMAEPVPVFTVSGHEPAIGLAPAA